jgi:choline dehydrogenase-like flavoprotein
MIRNAREIEENSLLECDLCIAGAGAAGITLARELSGGRLRVIMLESGGLDFDAEIQELYQATLTDKLYNDPEYSRLRFFGGSTNHWAGNCSPLDPIDFERRPWLPHSGWPFGRETLDPYYVKAQQYCQLDVFNYDAEYWRKFSAHPLLPLDPEKVVTGVAQHSPPTRFGEVYRNDIGDSQNVTVYLNADLTGVNLHQDGGHVETVQVAATGGRRFQIRARFFVLALGGIENARMLLNCDEVQKNGIGNQYDLAGRYFMDHAIVSAATFFLANPQQDIGFYGKRPSDHPGKENRYAPYGFLKLSDAAISAHQLNNVRAPLLPISRFRISEGVESLHQISSALSSGRMPENLGRHIVNVVRDWDMVIEGVARKSFNTRLFDSANDMNFLYSDVMIEMRPEPSNRITLSAERDRLGLRKAVVSIRLAEDDKENLWRAMQLIASEFARAELGRMRIEGDREGRTFGELLSFGDHHIGTTRAHQNQRHGVVDGDLKVHGVDNLYVAGSSVFPTGGHVPPTLTLVALAVRMAEHLNRKLEGA